VNRFLPLVLLIMVIAGCAPTAAERVHALNQQGVEALRRQDYLTARARFEQALEVQPENAISRYNLANAAHQGGDLHQAEQSYKQALEHDPNYGPARHGLALLYLQTNRSAEAYDLVHTWVTQKPELADAHAEYGWYLREQGDLPAAQVELQQALELDPGNVRALIELGSIYDTYSHPDRAASLFQRALRRAPAEPEILERLASMKRSR
jgi:Tfp pilus assembly protein PilF